MELEDQFPEIYKEWVGAGAIRNNFRTHLLALGVLPATKDDVRLLADELQAKINQLRNVVNTLPFA